MDEETGKTRGTLSPSLLDEIKHRIVAELNPARLYLFGSHAWGQPDRDSDMDFCLVVRHLNGSRADLLRRAYRCTSDLRVPTEFVVKTEAEMARFSPVVASLAHKVQEKGVLLHG